MTRPRPPRLTMLVLATLLSAGCAADAKLRRPQTGEVPTCTGGYRPNIFGGLVGCAADVQLRNPQTREATTCVGGYRTTGLGGLVDRTAKEIQFKCIDDYRAQGYVRVPE